jgi:hypothetical protein
MEPHEYQGQSETSEHRILYVSGEVILYSAHDLARMTGWSLGTIYRLFDDPDIPVIDYGKGKLVENHALMQFFSSRRDEVNRYSFQLKRNPWEDKIYSSIYSNLRADYLDRCKKVDDLQLDWLDALMMFASPEVVFFTEEDILKKSNWTEEEVRMLFLDFRFPRVEFARKNVVEVHALIHFFARKEYEKKKQLAEYERYEERFAHLHRERSGR